MRRAEKQISIRLGQFARGYFESIIATTHITITHSHVRGELTEPADAEAIDFTMCTVMPSSMPDCGCDMLLA